MKYKNRHPSVMAKIRIPIEPYKHLELVILFWNQFCVSGFMESGSGISSESGSGYMDPGFSTGFRIRIRIGSVFNRASGSGSGSRRAKITHKSRKNSCFEVLDGLFCELEASSVTWTYFMEA
jgi:hypothetical protein